MVQCKVCGRRFNPDRVTRHEEICEKTSTKKRKVYDIAKHRLKGTDIEQYVRKTAKINHRYAPGKELAVVANGRPDKKSDWRRKHEEFIEAIQAAKKVQVHLARGGKLADLPPPPPSENPDYIECPHCHRRFNEAAAARHIPKCASYLHNKPKPVRKY